MHVIVPETFYVMIGNYRAYLDTVDGVREYYHPILIPDPEEGRKDSHTLVWKERRRKTFSDVCHAKLVEAVDLLGDCPTGLFLWDTTTPGKNYSYATGNISWDRNYENQHCVSARINSNGRIAILTIVETFSSSASRKHIVMNSYLLRFEKWYKPTQPQYRLQTSHLLVWFDPVSNTYRVRSKKPDTLGLADYMVDLAKNYMPEMYIPDADLSKIESVTRDCADRVFKMTYYRHIADPTDRTGTVCRPSKVSGTPVEGNDVFLLHEPQVIMDRVDDVLLGKGTEKYFRNVLIQNAYVDAVRNVPRLNDNSVSNILEIISFIVNLVVNKRVQVPDSLSDLWLAYRYSYGTGKSDAEEAIRFVHRHMDLGRWDNLKTYGQYHLDYGGVPIRCRCEFVVENKNLSQVQRIWKALYTYGLSPNFYVVWDMIPYSFIVDWFIPIGNVAAALDAEHAVAEYYKVRDINFSLSYTRVLPDGRNVKCYTRWLSSTPPELHGYYFLENDPSQKTIAKRVLDAASLFIG